MHEFLWITFDWPLLLFALAAVASLVIMFKVGRVLGLLILALVIYCGTVWNPWWGWLPDLFFLAVIVGIVGIGWGLINGGGRSLGLAGAITAVVVALLVMNGNFLGASPPMDREVPGITGRFNEMESDLESERNYRIENDNDVREDMDELKKRMNKLERQVDADR